MSIMYFSMMTTPGRPRFISISIRVRYSHGSKSLKLLLRTKQEIKLKY
jgi:hypothetical protein